MMESSTPIEGNPDKTMADLKRQFPDVPDHGEVYTAELHAYLKAYCWPHILQSEEGLFVKFLPRLVFTSTTTSISKHWIGKALATGTGGVVHHIIATAVWGFWAVQRKTWYNHAYSERLMLFPVCACPGLDLVKLLPRRSRGRPKKAQVNADTLSKETPQAAQTIHAKEADTKERRRPDSDNENAACVSPKGIRQKAPLTVHILNERSKERQLQRTRAAIDKYEEGMTNLLLTASEEQRKCVNRAIEELSQVRDEMRDMRDTMMKLHELWRGTATDGGGMCDEAAQGQSGVDIREL